MERFTVEPGGVLRGAPVIPGDKSISHRAVMFAALAVGDTRIDGFLDSADCLATLAAFAAMGIDCTRQSGALTVRGGGLHGLAAPRAALDLGNSGTSMRLLAGVLAGQAFDSVLTGDASLSRRPMARIVEPLRRMGALINAAGNDCAPLAIRGGRTLRGIDHAPAVASAQVKSCLLLAGLYARGTTRIDEPGVSRDHTERMLAAFGVAVERAGRRVALTGGQALRAADVVVPADLSSAAFFLVGASIAPGSKLHLAGVGINPTRRGVVDILRAMGADIELRNPRAPAGEPVADIVVRGAGLRGVAIGPDQVALAIDEFPALFVAAACARGVTRLTGAAELRVKESDRIAVMADGLAALGVEVAVRADGIEIVGRPRAASFNGGRVASRGDHRVAMAFAMAGLRAAAPIVVDDCAAVATSFPGFAAAAAAAGLAIDARALP